jgi:TRAP-type C4-dicarboxylate transport system permease small subunit
LKYFNKWKDAHMNAKFRRFEANASRASEWFNWVAVAAFIVMAIVTTADVIGAKLFGKPILISFDIVAYAGLLGVVPAVAWIQANHGHIEVELLTRRMKPHARRIVDGAMYILGILLFIAMIWQMMDYGLTLQRTERVSSVAAFPMAPFAYISVLCFLMVLIVLVAQFLVLVTEEVGK